MLKRIAAQLFIAAALHALIVLAVYVAMGGNPMNRVGFAVFTSCVPAILTVIVRLMVRWNIVIIYALFSIFLHVLFVIAEAVK